MQSSILIVYKNHVTETLEYIQSQVAKDHVSLDFVQFNSISVLLENGYKPRLFTEGKPLNTYDLYFFRTTTPYILDIFPLWYPESEFIFPATPHKKQDKLWMMSIFHHHNLSIPKTLALSTQAIFNQIAFIEQEFHYPFVLKEITGAHGKQVFLINNREELQQMSENPAINHTRPILIQEMIPNDGDYRVIIADNTYQTSFFRTSAPNDWRNNTSLGGTLVEQEIDTNYRKIAETACEVAEMPLAGVDIMIDKITKQAYLLEINPAFQITSNNGDYKQKADIVSQYLVHRTTQVKKSSNK